MGTPHSPVVRLREQSVLFSSGLDPSRDSQKRRAGENSKNGKACVLAWQWTLGVRDSSTLNLCTAA